MPLFISTMLERFYPIRSTRARHVVRVVYRLLAIASVVAMSGTSSHAQTPSVAGLDPGLDISQFVHESWTTENGLPQNSVTAVLQAADGYLWLGTQAGLVRFDGLEFRVYDKEDGLGSNEVRALLQDKEGAIWVGTNGGGVTRMWDDSVETYSTANGLPSDAVRSLFEDESGTMWIGTIEGGVARFDGGSFSTYSTKNGLAGDVVLAIEQSTDGTMWFGTQGGLSFLSQDGIQSLGVDDGLPGELVWALEPRPQGGFWVGTSGGLAIVQDDTVLNSYKEFDGLCGQTVSALNRDGNGSLWIGSLGGGLCRLVDGQVDRFSQADGLTNDRIRSLTSDREGGLWIGTESGGLNRLHQGKFTLLTTSEGLTDDMVITVVEDGRGRLWIGTKNGGLHRVEPDGREISHLAGLPSRLISATQAMDDGVWVGMYAGGVCRVGSHVKRCYSSEHGLKSDNVFAVLEDSHERVWIGTDAGLSVLGNDKTFFDPGLSGGTSTEPITVIHEDSRGDIWIGLHDGHVARISLGDVVNADATEWMLDAPVVSVDEDDEGMIWAGTYGSGLCRISGTAYDCLTADRGLLSDYVLQVVLDDNDDIWLGTQEGVARLDRDAAVQAIDDGEAPQIQTFIAADGLQGAELNGGSQPPIWKTESGIIWFATSKGAASINPNAANGNPIPPSVHLESIIVDGDAHVVRNAVAYPEGRRDVEFHYTGISFTAPEQVQFEYKLEGYDADWIDAGNRREAYYTNLAPGEYTFRVRAANNDGVWNEEGASVSFYLEPFFYETWWFAVLCGVAAIGLVIAGYRLRIRQMKAREHELEEQVDERTRDLRKEKDRTEEAKQVIEGQATELRSLNDHLEEQAEKLRDLNENLQQKVEEQFQLLVKERERYETNLIDAKDRAEASDRLKTAILNNLSHEFRTPLTAILGFTEIISMEAPDDLQEFTAEIDRGGKRLLRTLDALLEFSRLEANESAMKAKPLDLTTTVFSVVRQFKMLAERKKIDLQFKASAPIRATLDPGAMEEIIWNLIDNAIKFTQEGEVEVTTGVGSDHTFVRVRDTGVGIGTDFQAHMYEAFSQESDGFDRAFEGVGLGLTITKRLVEHMGGTIEFETEVDVGTTFTVYLPAREAVAA